jgi:hypothetical protein
VYARTSAANVDARVVICEIEKRGRMQAILCLSGPQKRPEPPDQPVRRRGLQERLRDQGAGPCTEAGPGPRARTDLEEAVHRRAVPGLSGERTPEKVLVESKRARVRIALLEIDVGRLEVGL